MSAADCSVRVAAGCGRQSAVQTGGGKECPATKITNFLSVAYDLRPPAQHMRFYDQRLLMQRLLGLLLRWKKPHTRPEPRCVLGTADLCFLGDPLRSDFGVVDVKVLQEGRYQDRVTHDVAVIHVSQVCQASVFLQRTMRVVGTGKLLRSAKLEVG